ncbi:hypothetical protein [Actinoplanes sp. NPDC023714]|uniref:hypothetical protein n=1 Tax=Actinoplanes sp. NPDC023714 TaxID=3154322 RepID=UPI0033CBF814
MTDQPTTPATEAAATPEVPATEAKPKTTRRAPAKKAPAKKEFAPKVTESGRLDHSDCGHERTAKGRSACRAEYAKTNKQG